jgi:hypothetical protein
MVFSDRRKVLLKYTLVFLIFVSLTAMIMGIIFVVLNTLEGPEYLTYLHRGTCLTTKINFIENRCPTDNQENFGLYYAQEWQKCELIELEIENNHQNLNQNCTYIFPESFFDHNQALIAVRREFKVGDNFGCVIDEIQHYCYPDQSEVLIEILIIVLPLFGIILFSLLTFCIYYRTKPLHTSLKLRNKI